jgi:hypothetical protein
MSKVQKIFQKSTSERKKNLHSAGFILSLLISHANGSPSSESVPVVRSLVRSCCLCSLLQHHAAALLPTAQPRTRFTYGRAVICFTLQPVEDLRQVEVALENYKGNVLMMLSQVRRRHSQQRNQPVTSMPRPAWESVTDVSGGFFARGIAANEGSFRLGGSKSPRRHPVPSNPLYRRQVGSSANH